MSHSSGAVIRNGQVLGFFEYNSTSDVAISAIWPTYEELHENWRSGIWNRCACGDPPQEVVLYTNYGQGFHWSAKVCLRCKAIVENLMPFELDGVERIDGLPPLEEITTKLLCMADVTTCR